MVRIKLINALSYMGAVEATAKNPFVDVDDVATANAAVATGYFEIVSIDGNEEEAASEEVTTPAYGGKTLNEMTAAEIETYATYNNVSLKGLRSKAKMIAKLCEELGIDADTEVEYGSPTIVELQEE